MKRSGFRQQSIEEIKAKQAAKRKAAPKVHKGTKRPAKSTTGGNKRTSRAKPKTAAKLKKELDTVFSLYIRNKYADDMGNVECYTCNKMFTVKTIQNGHFVTRQYLATRWHENNCRPQCFGCNGFGGGKPLDFEERLKKELGNDYVEEMKASRHQSLKLDRNWYTEQIALYKEKLLTLTS